MTVLLFLLAGVWAVFLLPPYVRKRRERSANSISSFRRHLSTLERTTPRSRTARPGVSPSGPIPPAGARPERSVSLGRGGARRRRRDILFTLAGAAAITFVLAVTLGDLAIAFHGLADVLLAGYLYLLVRVRRSEAERAAKVRFLPGGTVSPEPAMLLRRSASS